MKIAYFVYPSAFQNKGGGEILLEKLEERVKSKGVTVKRFDTWNDKIESFDILHVFGSVKECLPLMDIAASKGVKIVLESIFWSDFRRAFFETGPAIIKAEMIARHLTKILFPFFPSSRKKMFETADLIIPNSVNEARQIARLFNIPQKKMFVVPNGVDMTFSSSSKNVFVKKYNLENFVLTVGRIEPRKNQLNLIKAMNGIDKALVIIGEAVTGYEWYYEKCRKAAGENTHFLGKIDHDSDLLKSAYKAAGIFVLPGWFETPGLAALEAGISGSKLVATSGGSTKEYFLDKALYINPASSNDIRVKIRTALETEKTTDLQKLIIDNYTWDKVAEKTIEAYEKALNSKS